MNNDNIREKIFNTAVSVLQQTAFIFADEFCGDEAFSDTMDGVSVEFRGPENGVVQLWIAPGMGASIAANMLGVEEDSIDAAQKSSDALKELANIFTGNLLTALYGTEPIFELGIPQLLTDSSPHDISQYAVWLNAEEKPMLVFLERYD